MLRHLPLQEADVDDITHGFIERWDLGPPIDEPTIAAIHCLALDSGKVQPAFAKWLRPNDLVRVSLVPAPG
ncbi:MAG: hypothetical protein WCA45_08100 [Thiobacillaceae bacterium]